MGTIERPGYILWAVCLPFLSAFKSMQGGIPEMWLLLQTATHKSTAQSGHKNKSDKLYEIPQARKQRSWKSLLQVNTGATCELKVSVWIARVLTSLIPMRIYVFVLTERSENAESVSPCSSFGTQEAQVSRAHLQLMAMLNQPLQTSSSDSSRFKHPL